MLSRLFRRRQVMLTSKKYVGTKKTIAKRHPKKRKIAKKIKTIFGEFITRPLKKKRIKKKRIKKKKSAKKKIRLKQRPKKLKKSKKPKKLKRLIERRGKMAEEKPKEAEPKEVEIGEVTHFFPHVNAAVIKLKEALSEGETVHIKGHTTDFKEQVTSMQINNKPIKEAKKGDEVGLLVKEKVRGGDIVYKETA